MATDNRNIDFATRYSNQLDQKFTANSFTKRFMGAKGEYRDVDGVQSVYFYNVDTTGSLKGHTTSAFTAPTATLTTPIRKDVEYFYEISQTLPAVKMDDSNGALKEGGRVMSLILKEEYIPLYDKIALGTAIGAATGFGAANTILYDEDEVLLGINKMIAVLAQQRSYSSTQALFIAASVKPFLDQNLFTSYTPDKNDTVVEKGDIKRLLGVPVVFVPDELMVTITNTGTAPYAQAAFTAAPKVKAVLWDTRVMGAINKMEKTYVITGKEAAIAGYDGAVLRGLFRPGAWVFDANNTKKAIALLQAA